MKKPTPQIVSKAEAQLVSFPVFANADPVGRVAAMAVAGQRDMQISVRGERVIEQIVEVERAMSHEDIVRDVSVEQLVEILKIKMFNEGITDQALYDLLFEDRLERQWARAYRSETTSLWKKVAK